MSELTRDEIEEVDLITTAAAQVMACDLTIMREYDELEFSELVDKFKPLMESAIIRAIALHRENEYG